MSDPRGISGLTGREPIAAALTVGVKGSNGAPTEKDRFHILEAVAANKEYSKRDGGTYSAPARALHAGFAAFNTADAARRRSVPARLAHITVEECFEYRLQCQQATGIPAHPKKAPVCIGNGTDAKRWNGTEYLPIKCLGQKCEHSMPTTKNGRAVKPACGPWMRFVARFDWPRVDGKGLPNVPFKFTSGGWNSTREFVGFFDAFRRACAGFGVDPSDVPLFGMPVLLTLTERTNPAAASRFPVVSITMGGDGDLIEWIGSQLARRRDVQALARTAPVLALTDAESGDAETLAGDYITISGGLNVP